MNMFIEFLKCTGIGFLILFVGSFAVSAVAIGWEKFDKAFPNFEMYIAVIVIVIGLSFGLGKLIRS